MEFKCALCNSTNLLKAEKESALIKNAHYTNCMDCGNVMILLNDTLIPTPTEDNEMTKAMIEDAAQAFKMNRGVSLQAVSLTEDKDMETHMQPTTVKENMKNYVNMHMHTYDELDEINDFTDLEECECEEEIIPFDDFDGDYGYLEQVREEEVDKELSLKVASELRTEGHNYLLILPNGDKQVYRNCSKEFILSIINSIGSHVQLFELNEIELKTQVKYNF